MTHFIGEPRYFQDCEPGDLIRIAHRGQSRFAFAVCGSASGLPDRVVVLDQADSTPLVRLDGGELVIFYGKNYRVQESMSPSSLLSSSQPQPGMIVWALGREGPEAKILATGERGTGCVDLATGLVSLPRGGPAFNLVSWSLILTFMDGSDPIKVFEATGKAT